MAKKNPKNIERRAMVERMRQEQARKERARSMMILGVCVVAVIGLLAAALVPYIKDKREQDKIAGLAIDKIGATESAAGCDDVTTKSAEGSGVHKAPGTHIDYPDAPPAFGPHWGNYLTGSEIRNLYTPEDRPDLERVVHSLEHGHTLFWYDDTITPGSAEYKDLEAIADKFSDDPYFNIVPWKSTDGGAFPDGKHVALTHWTGPKDQKGVWQYCAKPSGEVIKSFVKDYPASNAPEAGAA